MQIITNQFQKELKKHGDDSFPFLVSYERLSGYEQGSFLWHWHTEIELTLVTKGEMLYRINDKRFHLREGQALFGNTAALHSGSMVENRDCEYAAITFDSRLVYGYENSTVYSKFVLPILQNFSMPACFFDLSQPWHKKVIDILKALCTLYDGSSPIKELEIQRELIHFWQLLYLHADGQAPLKTGDKRNYERIREILVYIETNYAAPLTLEDISRHVHLCRSECSRLFKRYMKISLFDFLLEYRIAQSLAFLSDSHYSIREVSERCGFRDSNYYSKVFRRQKGCSPMAYRKALFSGRQAVPSVSDL